MKFLVVGCGSIGTRHLRNLKLLGYEEVSVLRSQKNISDSLERDFDVVSFFDLDSALAEHPDVVIISNPTVLHIPIALTVAKTGVNLFIEKPLSNSMDQIDDLLEIVTAKSLIVMVAYNLRFHAALIQFEKLLKSGAIGNVLYARAEVGSYLPEWRPQQDYRKSYSANQGQGGGVVLDLSHDIDYMLWLFGSAHTVTAQVGKLSDLDISVEDTADLLIEHENGIQTSLHMDYFQRDPTRKCKVVGTNGTALLNLITGSIELYQVGEMSSQTIKFEQHHNDMYLDELKYFVDCVKEHRQPLSNLQNGIEVLQVALAAKTSANLGKRMELANVPSR